NCALEAANSVTDFDVSEWSALAADSTFMLSHGWFAASERIRDIRPRYLAVRSDQRLLGVLPCYIDASGKHSRYQPALVLPEASQPTESPWIIEGSPAGYDSNVLVARGMSVGDVAEVLCMLAGYGYRVGRLSEGWDVAGRLIAQVESKYGNEIEHRW